MNDNLPAVRVETNHDLVNPTTDSWTVALAPVVELARSICGTDFVPDGMRDNVAATTAAIMYGRELGLPPMTALGSTHMIKGRVGVSAEILRALVLEQGHEIVVRESSGGQVVMAGRRKGSTDWTVVTWTLDDARRAKLSGDNWTKYPRQMLAARASAELCRLIFADVIHGMAATEELEGIDAPALAGPVAPGGNGTKVQRKSRTAKTDDGAVLPADAPAAGGPSAAPSSPPMPPLPGEPGFDGPVDDAEGSPQTDDGVALPVRRDGEPGLAAAPSSQVPLPGEPEPSGASDEVAKQEAGPPINPVTGCTCGGPDGSGGWDAPPGPDHSTWCAIYQPRSSELPPEGDPPGPPEDITDPQRKKMFALMTEHGLNERSQQIGWISKNLNRDITSRTEVNKDDAIKLIDILEQLDETARPVSRGDLRLLAGLFKELGITDTQERLHIASSIVGRTPMKGEVPSAEGMTSREAGTLLQGLGRCRNRDQVEALVQMAEQQRAEQGGES